MLKFLQEVYIVEDYEIKKGIVTFTHEDDFGDITYRISIIVKSHNSIRLDEFNTYRMNCRDEDNTLRNLNTSGVFIDYKLAHEYLSSILEKKLIDLKDHKVIKE